MSRSHEAYRAQFELAREVEALQAEVTAGSESGRVLIEALAERRKTAAGELAAEMARLETRAWELAGSLPSSNRYGAEWRWEPL